MAEPTAREPLLLAQFLRGHRKQILDRWEERVLELRVARALEPAALRDHLPEMLDRIAQMVDDLQAGRPLHSPDRESSIHANERLIEGYGLGEVVREYEILRDTVMALLEEEPIPRLTVAEIRVLHRAIGQAVELTVRRYAETRDRTISAIDSLTNKALVSSSLTDLLGETLRALFDSVPAVDCAAVLLRENDHLVVRAAAGIPPAYVGSVLRFGEGLAGRVAQTRAEVYTRDASSDPMVVNKHLLGQGLHALHGVPLLHGNMLVGVAQIGSTTAHAFSQGDRVLFRALAGRMTSLIVQSQGLEREQQLRAEAQEALAALEREHARFDALVRQLPAGVVVAEAPSGRLILANQQAEELLGQTLPELPEAGAASRIRADHEDGSAYTAEEYPLARALNGDRVPGEVMVYTLPSGRRRFLNVQSSPVEAPNGTRIGAVATFTDVTELKQAEDELRRSLEFQEQVMGILGHDLRTPLSVISTSAALMLRSGELPQRELRLTGRIAEGAERMARMISDLLDYSRARGPGIPVHHQPLNLRHLARHAIEELGVAYPARVVRLSADEDTQGLWDGDRLSQVMGNLLGNALRYSPEDSPVDVQVRDAGESVALAVHNLGSPIPHDHLATLFDPFRRGPGAHRSPEGLGLGLFIVREIVRAHGGTVHVTSSEAAGTTFTLHLPRRPPGSLLEEPPGVNLN
jgi:PAS domain S-box-containing protein